MVNHNNHSGYKKVTSCCLKSRLKLVLEVKKKKKKRIARTQLRTQLRKVARIHKQMVTYPMILTNE